MTSIAGRTAIVTGASRGIGKQLALELARHGVSVVVAARTVTARSRLPGTIGETVEAIEEAGGRALAVAVDLHDAASIERLVAATLDTYGRVDLLVNNAADTSGGTPLLADLDLDDWRRQFEVNLNAPLALMKSVVPHMAAVGGGVIINMTSGAGDLSTTSGSSIASEHVRMGERLAYATSKAALNRLANALAPELSTVGVAVVNVDPGFTRTELVDLLSERGVVDADAAVPMGLPVATVLHVVLADDPMTFTGQLLRAADFTSLLEVRG